MLRLHSSILFPYTTLFRSHVDAAPGDARFASLWTPVPASWSCSGDAGFRLGIHADGDHHHRRGYQAGTRSEEHTSELQSRLHLVCRLLLEKKKQNMT